MRPPKTKDDGASLIPEPNWFNCYLGSYPEQKLPSGKGINQQSDLLELVLNDIVNYGLNYTYLKYRYKGADLPITGEERALTKGPWQYSKTSHKKRVIIVGAGLAGLSAAYELTLVGLSRQNRGTYETRN